MIQSPREPQVAAPENEKGAAVPPVIRAEGANLGPDELHALAADIPLVPPKEPLGARFAGYFARHQMLLFVLSLLLLWLILALPPAGRVDLKLGQPSPMDVVAPKTAYVPDTIETARRREAAAALVPPAYDSSSSAQSQALLAFRGLASQSRQAAAMVRASGGLDGSPGSQLRAQALFQKAAGWRPSINEVPALLALTPDGWDRVRHAGEAALGEIYRTGQIRADVERDFEAAQARLTPILRQAVEREELGSGELPLAEGMARRALHFPNLKVDENSTQLERRKQRDSVAPVFVRIEANTTLVHEGEPISDEQWDKLQALGLVTPQMDWRVALARFVLCAILVAAAAAYLARSRRDLLARPSALWLIAVVPVLFLATFRLLIRVPHTDFLMPPLATSAAMLLTVLIDARIGLSIGFVVAALCALMAEADAGLFLISCLSAWIGTLGVSKLPSRAAQVRAGCILFVTNAVLAAALGVLRDTPFEEITSTVAWSALAGAGSVAVMTGLAMFLERPFGITSHLRLLDLMAPDETVLRRMQTEAPGTYTHSLMVATLSESAAKAVGADALLCRVGGLYHDIGKLRRPHCFVENQSGDNIHDRISPGLSALLIKAHVKDGLELGRALRLPLPVLEIIQQHHGTSVIAYFYHKARQAAEESGLPAPEEENFRYSGPKAKSKESAIVMLADSIEASSRALPQVTPEILEAHIKSIVQGRLRDGELDEAELTLNDIGIIQEAFTLVLRGVMHHRIEYPNPAEIQNEAQDQDWVREALRPEGFGPEPVQVVEKQEKTSAGRGGKRRSEENKGNPEPKEDAGNVEKRQNNREGKSRERRRGRKWTASDGDNGRPNRSHREEQAPKEAPPPAEGRRGLASGLRSGFPAFHVPRHDGRPSESSPENGKEPNTNGRAPQGQHRLEQGGAPEPAKPHVNGSNGSHGAGGAEPDLARRGGADATDGAA